MSVLTVMKTRSALAEIGISHGQFRSGLVARKFAAPQKDESGDFIWTDEDVERVKAALNGRPARNADSAGGCGDR